MKKKEKLKLTEESNIAKTANFGLLSVNNFERINDNDLFSVNPVSLNPLVLPSDNQSGGGTKSYHSIKVGCQETGGGCDYNIIYNKYTDEGYFVKTWGICRDMP